MSENVSLTAGGGALTTDALRQHLAKITDPAEIGTAINQLDAWVSALREIGTNTEQLIDAVYQGVEYRCRAVEIYDALEDESGKRTDVTSFPQGNEVSPKQQARDDLRVVQSTLARWRLVKRIPTVQRQKMYTDARDHLDEKFSIKAYSDWAKQWLKEQTIESAAQAAARILADDAEFVAPTIYLADAIEFLSDFEDDSFDLLLTDPPYSTDIDDIESFANAWLPLALSKVKPAGRAYICIGAYPGELLAYLSILQRQEKFIVDVPLIWTYRNTLGVTPKMKYNLNYQVVFHLYSPDSRPLDNSITNEMFSVQDINAPDGRLGDRYHTWQKPDELARRLIKHSTVPGEKILDPFACTGTFPLMAARMQRWSEACDLSADNLSIAQGRGCNVVLG